MDLTQYIRDVPDFPKPGILFRDITPLLREPRAFREAIAQMAAHYGGRKIDVVAAAEARGFIFAAPLALELNVGFVPVRKPGKLPFDTFAFHYELEYGRDTLEMHRDGIAPGQNVLLVDDLLLVQSEAGDVALVEANPKAFRELTRFTAVEGTAWNPPALAGRKLLVRSNSEAACYEVPAASP